MAKNCHFCVVTNSYMCGHQPGGRPDDCIGCGMCDPKDSKPGETGTPGTAPKG